ncbi:MAG: D-alanyl-D-alanine carboxypeptidase [Clostridia bacterium]|nr:D-alanyl-D-alanine carboxypeptidase [Clostridia bacterium]
MKKNVKIACLALSLALCSSFGVNKAFHTAYTGAYLTASAESATAQTGLTVQAKSAYVMDYVSGTPIYEKEATKRLPIASMCKIMTLLLAFEAIDEGAITMDEEVSVSENAAAMGGSQVFLEAGGKYPVRELIKSIVVCSANDSCVALAERISGSDGIFVDKMNARAKELGCENTLFANCTGLPKEPQYSCAIDVAKMLKALLAHEEYFQFGKIWMDKFQHPEGRYTEISNTNRLVRFYDGCDGGKTGFTSQAGFCLAATAKRNNMRVISVVIGEENSKQRFADVSTTFDYAFANYTMQTVVDGSKPIEGEIKAVGGKKSCIIARPERDSALFIKRGEKSEVTLDYQPYTSVKAPIKAGDRVGEIIVYRDGVQVDKVALVSCEDAEKAGFFDCLKNIANAWNFN